MELKDLILSTLAELEKNSDDSEEELERKERAIKSEQKKIKKIEDYENEDEVDDFTSLKDSLKPQPKPKPIPQQEQVIQPPQPTIEDEPAQTHILSIDEGKFLTSLRERILVLIEGLQSPNNTKLESKIDIIINFLEYQLSVIDERLESKNAKHR